MSAEPETTKSAGTERAMSWTQPICEPCWTGRNPDRPAHRMNEAPVEQCAYCGHQTDAGIFVRDNPANVRFPRPKEDD